MTPIIFAFIRRVPSFSVAVAVSLMGLIQSANGRESVDGWLNWRGPEENGSSLEINLPEQIELGGDNLLWSYPISGGGTPVIAGNRVFVFAYRGEGKDLQEALLCFKASTGELIWERRFNDFLSDIIYNRYAIGAPAIDPDSGNVYLQTSAGLLLGFDQNGKHLWEHSMLEEYGRLTFPNGRTGGPVVDGDLVIVHGITTNWGKNGPARDRFYAFDKYTGKLVWYSQPGVQPKDSSFSTPVFGWLDGRRVFYCGTGCGNIVCVDARTGQPLWRFQMSHGGVNSSVVLHGKENLIAIHGKENVDSSTIGRMVSLKIPTKLPEGVKLPLVLNHDAEVWRNDCESFTSSSVLVDDLIYQTVRTGELKCIDANTGEELWIKKLSPDQLHASPVWADDKLYVPMLDGNFYIIRPGDTDAEILDSVKLEGNCLGAPAVNEGRIYVITKKKLYCFGSIAQRTEKVVEDKPAITRGAPAALQIVPAEFAVRFGESVNFSTWIVDANGYRLKKAKGLNWDKFSPSLVEVDSSDALTVPSSAKIFGGNLKATKRNLTGSTRGRILPNLYYKQDYESFKLDKMTPSGEAFAYPPSPWLGARLRWRILNREGNQLMENTLERVLFQRSMNFIGHPEMRDYTFEADVMSDGNRRVMSNVGLINQRYLIALVGNWQILEVVSNHDRLKESVPFKWKANVWYRLKTRVDVDKDGAGVVRVKAWEKSDPEPDAWTLEVAHEQAHQKGAPGLYAFSPQSQKHVYIDNLSISPSE